MSPNQSVMSTNNFFSASVILLDTLSYTLAASITRSRCIFELAPLSQVTPFGSGFLGGLTGCLLGLICMSFGGVKTISLVADVNVPDEGVGFSIAVVDFGFGVAALTSSGVADVVFFGVGISSSLSSALVAFFAWCLAHAFPRASISSGSIGEAMVNNRRQGMDGRRRDSASCGSFEIVDLVTTWRCYEV